MNAAAERDIWTALFERTKQRYIDQGMPPEKADDKASSEVRRQIREGK